MNEILDIPVELIGGENQGSVNKNVDKSSCSKVMWVQIYEWLLVFLPIAKRMAIIIFLVKTFPDEINKHTFPYVPFFSLFATIVISLVFINLCCCVVRRSLKMRIILSFATVLFFGDRLMLKIFGNC